jgi:NAD(P)H-hydrate epimerase
MKSLEAIADSTGNTYRQLMLTAGERLYEEIVQAINNNNNTNNNNHEGYHKSIVFLCGNGNNAGDCFVACNILSQRLPLDATTITVAMLCGEPKTPLAQETFKPIIAIPKVSITHDLTHTTKAIAECDVLVDGIFGTGFHGELPQDIQRVLATPTKAYKLAVDIPSGVNCNTGEVSLGTLSADSTITFAYPKLGMFLPPADTYCGSVTVADIGITETHYQTVIDNYVTLLTKDVVSLPKRSDFGNKGTFGRVLHVTGSSNMLGACIMASRASLRCGVGLVTVSTPKYELLPLTMPEPIYIGRDHTSLDTAIAKASAVLIGCGLGTGEDSIETFTHVLNRAECPLIIDADGINILANCIDIIDGKRVVLTPHPLEMSRLAKVSVSEVQSNRMKVSTDFAKAHQCVVVLKGANTIVTDGTHTYVDNTANSGLSKGGSGDVLAGMVASFVAQGMPLLEACKLSVYLHTRCGVACATRLTKYSTLPTDMVEELPKQIRLLI